MLHAHQVIISPLHLPTLDQSYLTEILSKKVTALAYEYIRDESDNFPIVSAMTTRADSARGPCYSAPVFPQSAPR